MSVADTVNTWARQHLLTGAVAQHTPSYNQVVAAIPALITQLEAGSSAATTPAALVAQAQAELAEASAALGAQTTTTAAAAADQPA